MEDYWRESVSPMFVSENNIRHIQSKIQSEIEQIEKDVTETTFVKAFNLCDNIKDQILNYKDEPHLSKSQNNFRRIHIASELFVSICSAHDHLVDFAFTKITHDLLLLEKYKIISSKISHKACLKLRREKHFAKEAYIKLVETLTEENERNNLKEVENTRRQELPPKQKQAEVQKESEINIQEEYPLDKSGDTLIENSFRDECPFTPIGEMTQVRVEPTAEASNLQIYTSNIPNDISLQPTETSIREPFVQQPVEEDINHILQSDDKIVPIDIRKSGLPENLLEPADDIPSIDEAQVKKLPTPTKSVDNQKQPEEDFQEWSLASLEPVTNARKKNLGVIIDKLTVIPNYSTRALQLNKAVEIQRVQVFEGPPKILQSMSADYLMKTPSHKKLLSQNFRSSIISKLYERNLTTEKRPVEPFVMPRDQKRSINVQHRDLSTSRLQIQKGIIEEVGERIGMHLALEKSDLLADVSEQRQPEVPERQDVINVPVLGRMSPIHTVEREKTNTVLSIPSPRIHQLQGTAVESRKDSPPWFFSMEGKPPRPEFREFNYVRNKIQNYWSLFEMQGMEKSISIREFLLFEECRSVENYLTVLRIVDKLSIRRDLFLEYKNDDVLIKPFQYPYISKVQFSLKGKEQRF